MQQAVINGIRVTFMRDQHEKAIEIVEMFDRLAVRPVMENEKREPAEVPIVLELPVGLPVSVLAPA